MPTSFSVPTFGKGFPLFSGLTYGTDYPLFPVPTYGSGYPLIIYYMRNIPEDQRPIENIVLIRYNIVHDQDLGAPLDNAYHAGVVQKGKASGFSLYQTPL